jgi:hypothetical protein
MTVKIDLEFEDVKIRSDYVRLNAVFSFFPPLPGKDPSLSVVIPLSFEADSLPTEWRSRAIQEFRAVCSSYAAIPDEQVRWLSQ